ncbi:hypothetical protein ACFLZI_01125 [Nitrospirota bacterium]
MLIRLLTSIKTSLWLFFVGLLFFFAGVLVIPKTMQLYSGIVDVLLFPWLLEQGFSITWWIWGMILTMGLIAFNTAVCSVDTIIKKKGKVEIIRLLAPQVVHLGVLVMLLGHMLTSVTGIRGEAVLREGDVFQIKHETGFMVERILVEPSSDAGVTWEVRGVWLNEDTPSVIKPSIPIYRDGVWLFIKSADTDPLQTILMARGDAGVFFMWGGSLVFLLGSLMFLLVRLRSRTGLV